jgi:general secretion pathway protein F
MPVYSFEAISAAGDTRKGVIEADSAKAARGLLRAQALVPLKVEVVSAQAGDPGQAGKAGRRGRVFSATALAIWTRQLAGLVSSGLTLERALASLSDEAEKAPERELVATLRAEVNGGSAFAKALAQHPREFSDIFVAVIGAGEQSGSLGLVLERLADDLEEQHALKAKLIGAALYPAIVSLVAVVIVLFLVTYVVPQVASVFAGSKRALPLLTVIMINTSAFLRSYGWLLALALAGGVFGLRMALANAPFREKFDAAWLNLPILGKMSRSYNSARFASTLAMLASAGVPILKALQAAAQTLSNRAMRSDALDALVLVREGAPLASALAQKKRFPGLLAMFARLGEQTGTLPLMLQRAAKQLSTEVQRRALQLATLLEPLLIVAMGLVVMLIVLAVLMPIIQLNQLVR